MSRKNGLFGLIGTSLILTFILASCYGAGTPVPQAILTATQTALPDPLVPTATVPIAPSATDTPIPTSTATENATPTPTSQLAAQLIPTLNAYCRKGPGTAYDQMTVLQKGTAYYVSGRNSLNTWWLIQAPGNVKCWVGDSNVGKQGPVEQVPIVQGQPLPGTPALFVNSYVCDTVLKTLGVAFNWAEVQNVTGYRIYRNGSLLTKVESGVTSYHDDAPLGLDLVYELEAYNAFGVAARTSTNVPACK